MFKMPDLVENVLLLDIVAFLGENITTRHTKAMKSGNFIIIHSINARGKKTSYNKFASWITEKHLISKP